MEKIRPERYGKGRNETWLIPFDASDMAAAEAVAAQLTHKGMACRVIPLGQECYVSVFAGSAPADVETIRGVIRDVLGW